MDKSPRSFQKFKKIPLLFSILFLGASIFVFWFLYSQINKNKISAEQMQTEWQTEASARNEVESLERLIKTTVTERALVESHFANSTDIVPLLDTIERLATSAGATGEVSSVDILKDKSGLMIDVKSSGSFGAVYKFLLLLENSPYEFEFTSVDIQNTRIDYAEDKSVVASEWSGHFKIKLLSFIQ